MSDELRQWLEVTAEAAREIARASLAASTTRWSPAYETTLPKGLCGVYVPLIGDGLTLQLGVLAERRIAEDLARALLGEPEGAPIESDADLFDAIGEISNLIAGGVKARLSGSLNVQLGVPLAMEGTVFPVSGSQVLSGRFEIDGQDVWLVLSLSRTCADTPARLHASRTAAAAC